MIYNESGFKLVSNAKQATVVFSLTLRTPFTHKMISHNYECMTLIFNVTHILNTCYIMHI